MSIAAQTSVRRPTKTHDMVQQVLGSGRRRRERGHGNGESSGFRRLIICRRPRRNGLRAGYRFDRGQRTSLSNRRSDWRGTGSVPLANGKELHDEATETNLGFQTISSSDSFSDAFRKSNASRRTSSVQFVDSDMASASRSRLGCRSKLLSRIVSSRFC